VAAQGRGLRAARRTRVRPASLARDMRRVVWPEHLARRLVEEAPSAYRDLGEVPDDQRDLVRRERRLTPLAVLKG
jgi:tRNA-splicing ligase RtcB